MLKQNEGAGSSKIVLPEQHEAARRAAKTRQRANRTRKVEPLFGETTRVRDLTLTERKDRAARRMANTVDQITEIEGLLRDGRISKSRIADVQAKLDMLREKAGTKRF